MKHKKREN